jgi:hypothetical protein
LAEPDPRGRFAYAAIVAHLATPHDRAYQESGTIR